MANEKRQPLLADKFLLYKPTEFIVDRRIEDRVRSRLLSAKRFRLDWEATQRAASVMRDIPDLLIREQQFARAPYPVTWIEFPFEPWWREITHREPAPDADTEIGYLIDNDNVYVVSGNDNAARQLNDPTFPQVSLLPLYYQLHRPWPLSEQLDFAMAAKVSRLGLDGFLWGESIYELIRDPDNPENMLPFDQQPQRILRENHTCSVLPLSELALRASNVNDIVYKMVGGASGELRNIIGLLLMMNRPSLTQYVRDIGHHRTFLRGKLRPYLSHTVVSITIDPLPQLRLVGTPAGEAVEKRRHEVRGAYCHDEAYRKGTKAGCVHEWTEHPDYIDEALDDKRWHTNHGGFTEFDNWKCIHCGGHRWWREHHERGNAGIGWVDKEYEITT
jgi:hypothetical protein